MYDVCIGGQVRLAAPPEMIKSMKLIDENMNWCEGPVSVSAIILFGFVFNFAVTDSQYYLFEYCRLET